VAKCYFATSAVVARAREDAIPRLPARRVEADASTLRRVQTALRSGEVLLRHLCGGGTRRRERNSVAAHTQKGDHKSLSPQGSRPYSRRSLRA